ncbi:MAG: hypothetical protein GXP49_02500 [Deltaproteobacteria bacterium]|nr:hypothetical protein [Deltaproteobacteria bacterium]
MSELLLSIIPVIVLFVVLSSFAYFYLGGRKKDQLEEGKVPLFQEQCGGRFDGFNLTIPFVRHTMYQEFIVIGYGKKRYIINYTDLNSVSLKRYLFSKGIIYSHSRVDLPRSIIIWSRSPEKVIELIKDKNIEVE